MKYAIILMIIGFALLLATPSVSAYARINIYVDNIGDSLFLGETNENLSLPMGVNIVNGKINGYSSNLTVKNGEVWTFEYNLPASELTIVLPEGAVVKDFSGGEVFLQGKQIAIYTKEGLRVSYVIEKQKESSNLNLLFKIIIGLFVILLVVYFFNFRKREKKEDKRDKRKIKIDRVKMLEGMLNEREKLILSKLKESGKTKNSYLRKACDIPKASFSRHIRELERKGLVKLSGEGKNKIVELNYKSTE